MKITILTDDNHNHGNELRSEHGLSVYAEDGDYTFLIDTGQSSLFLENARVLQKNISMVNYVIITHGHYDHINGLPHFLAANQKARIILSERAVHQQFFSECEDRKKYIGRNFSIRPEYAERLVCPGAGSSLHNGLFILSDIELNYPLPRADARLFKGINRVSAEKLSAFLATGETKSSADAASFAGEEIHCIPDDFDHEIIPCLYSDDDAVVFTGCAHKGVLNILEAVQLRLPGKRIKAVVGGFHLPNSTNECRYETPEEIDVIAGHLASGYPETTFYTGHCTGIRSFERMKLTMGQRIKFFYPGFTVGL